MVAEANYGGRVTDP